MLYSIDVDTQEMYKMTIQQSEVCANKSILRLDVGGRPMEWIDFEVAAYYYAKDLVLWTYGDPFKILRGGYNRLGELSTMDIHPVISNKGKMWEHMPSPPLSNTTLFKRDENTCLYCGHEFPIRMLTRDHIIPTSKGGQDTWMNVVCACKGCNGHKSNKTPEEAYMPLLAIPYVPNQAEYLFLIKNRTILGSQMDILKTYFKSERLISSLTQ